MLQSSLALLPLDCRWNPKKPFMSDDYQARLCILLANIGSVKLVIALDFAKRFGLGTHGLPRDIITVKAS